jgi:hypothetical protein
MAKVKISDLDNAAALDGTELVELEQDGTSVKCTTQDIADLGGGGVAPVEAKTADFTADGASGTIYTNAGASGDVVATLEDSAIGTEYTFIQSENGQILFVVLPDGHTLLYSILGQDQASSTVGDGSWTIETSGVGGRMDFVKIGATTWSGILVGVIFND